MTLFYLNRVDKNKYPDVVAPIGFSYMEKKDYNNAIFNLTIAYNNGIGKKEGYRDKITNSLGICYMQIGDLTKSKYFLLEAEKQGNPNSSGNLKILDRLIMILGSVSKISRSGQFFPFFSPKISIVLN